MTWFDRNPEFRRRSIEKTDDQFLERIREYSVRRGWSGVLSDYDPILGRKENSNDRRVHEDAVTCNDGISGKACRVKDLPR